jgi:glycosyltransferase involved in cell wall biosynthesis
LLSSSLNGLCNFPENAHPDRRRTDCLLRFPAQNNLSLSHLHPEVNYYAPQLKFILPGGNMISVIIPTFNRVEFVQEAVRSVLRQRNVPGEFEILVVDDGSTENVREAICRFPAKIKYIRQERRGVSAARNRGIEESSAQWIAFLDSDDLWLPGKLSAQLSYFSDNPEMLLCQTDEIWIRNGKRINPRRYHKKPEGHCFPLLLERCLVSPSAVMVNRKIFDMVGLFDESLPACEDYDLWLRIGHRFPFGLIGSPLVVKRGGHPDQLSSSIPALDKYRIHAILKLLRTESLNSAQKIAAHNTLRIKSRIYAEGCRRRGKTDEADVIENLVRQALH